MTKNENSPCSAHSVSTATLRFFYLAEQCHTHEILIWQKNENNPKNEHKFRYYSDLKIKTTYKINVTEKATPQMMLNRKCYQVSKPEIEFHMIDIMYAALHMRAHT